MLLSQEGERQRGPGVHESGEDDEDAGDDLERPPVGEQHVAEPGGPRPQEHEDRPETGDERGGGEGHAPRPRPELAEADSRDDRQVAGDERQDARGDEGHDAGRERRRERGWAELDRGEKLHRRLDALVREGDSRSAPRPESLQAKSASKHT
jgi:hypothetical protein